MASLLQNYRAGVGGLYGVLDKITRAASPGMTPAADPQLEELAGPGGAASARAQAQRAYNAQRAQALQKGARWWEMDALAAPAADDAYANTLMRSASAVDALRKRRTETDRQSALQRLLSSLPQEQQELAAADPEAFTQAAIKKQFAPENENFSMTALGDGSAIIVDLRSGKERIVRDPEMAQQLLKGLATVVEANDGRLYAFSKGGKVMNIIDGGPDLKQQRQEDREHVRARDRLRTEFRKLPSVVNYETQLPIMNSALRAPDTGAGDLDLIYAVGKILDPDSVVREGEMTLVMKSGSIISQLVGSTRLNLQGKGRIDKERRGQLMAMLQNRVEQSRSMYQRERDYYSSLAETNDLTPFDIVGDDAAGAFGSDTLTYERGPDGKLVRK